MIRIFFCHRFFFWPLATFTQKKNTYNLYYISFLFYLFSWECHSDCLCFCVYFMYIICLVSCGCFPSELHRAGMDIETGFVVQGTRIVGKSGKATITINKEEKRGACQLDNDGEVPPNEPEVERKLNRASSNTTTVMVQ